MTTFPGSPRVTKGALVGIDPANPLASVILFQYNPGTMMRQLEARAMDSQTGDRGKVYRLLGAPKETITLAIEIDAAKQKPLKEQFTKRM